MGLKTLKDMNMMYEGTPQGEAQLKEDLKQEAIKHCKELRKKENYLLDKNDFMTASFYAGMCSGLKIFMDLTEEDLK